MLDKTLPPEMHVHTSTEDCRTEAPADARALAAALLLLGAIVVFISSCGSQGLTFPGNVPATQTPLFTATPTP